MNLIMGYWGQGARRAYHHTAPVNAMYALHESLLMVQEEGLRTPGRVTRTTTRHSKPDLRRWD